LVIGALLLLSVILTAAVLFPGLGSDAMLAILGGAGVIGLVAAAPLCLRTLRSPSWRIDPRLRDSWRMPALGALGPARITPLTRLSMLALRGYLVIAGGLVLLRMAALAGVHL
jgi:hypothetical protein